MAHGTLTIDGGTTFNSSTVAVSGGGALNVGDPPASPTPGTLNVATLASSGGSTVNVNTDSTLDTSSAGTLLGTTNVLGTFNANSGGTGGANVTFSGPGTIGANGTIDSYGLSNILFSGGSAWVIASGGYLDEFATGLITLADPFTIMGNLNQSGNIALASGGSLGGPGSITDYGLFNWSGGTLALGGGFDVAGSADFQTTGSSFKLIDTVFSNDAIATTFGGTGTISVGGTASAP